MKQVPLVLGSVLMLVAAAHAQDFEKPVRLEAGGRPVDTDVGHAHPLLYDFDRDGKRDLLVGQFGEGKMKIFRNTGTNEKPVFSAEEWLKGGDTVVTTPTG